MKPCTCEYGHASSDGLGQKDGEDDEQHGCTINGNHHHAAGHLGGNEAGDKTSDKHEEPVGAGSKACDGGNL